MTSTWFFHTLLRSRQRRLLEPSRLPCPQMSGCSSGITKTTLFSSGTPSRRRSFSSALHHASTPTMPSYLSKNRSLSRWRGSSTGLMNISGSSSHFHPPHSLWTTSIMSWLLWPSSEHFPTPSMMLYIPSQSWTSLTSNQSFNRSETWTKRVPTSLERPQPSLHSQLHRSRPKSFLKRHSLLLPSPLPPHRLPVHRARAITLNVTSALALVILRPSASSRRS